MLKDSKNVFQNSFIFVLLLVFLTLYSSKLGPQLSPNIKNLFNNSFFRGLVIFLILYLSNRNIALSLMITIIFCVTMILVNRNNVENFMIRYGPALNNCNAYKNKNNYPLHDDVENIQFNINEKY